MIAPKENIAKLIRFGDSHPTRYGMIRLDRNERTLPFDEKILNDIKSKITDEMLMVYPEPSELYEKLAKFLGIGENMLFLAHGSDIAIKSVYETYIAKGDKILLHNPSYAMYKVYADLFEAQVVSVEFEKNFYVDEEKFLSLIDSSLRMVVFENPNGFVGTKPDFGFLKRVIQKCAECGVIAFIDEAYFYYIDESAVDLLGEFDNLIVSRSFSKGFGIASCRIGYLVSNEANIANIKKVKPMHEVTQFSIIAGAAVIENFELVMKNINEIKANLAYMKQRCSEMELRYSDSVANFFVVDLELENEDEFMRSIEEKKFLIRRPFELESLKGFRRVGVGTREQIDLFFESVKERRRK
jgi:histidinol-phosphate aminotransferase